MGLALKGLISLELTEERYRLLLKHIQNPCNVTVENSSLEISSILLPQPEQKHQLFSLYFYRLCVCSKLILSRKTWIAASLRLNQFCNLNPTVSSAQQRLLNT